MNAAALSGDSLPPHGRRNVEPAAGRDDDVAQREPARLKPRFGHCAALVDLDAERLPCRCLRIHVDHKHPEVTPTEFASQRKRGRSLADATLLVRDRIGFPRRLPARACIYASV
jgi:hypothetical protein